MTDALPRDGSSRYPLPPTDNPFAAAFAATRMPMLVTDPEQADNPIIYVNRAFTKLSDVKTNTGGALSHCSISSSNVHYMFFIF